MPEKACRTCRLIIADNLCPECKTLSASDDWIGEVIIFDASASRVAKVMTITKPGRYALRVR